MTQIELYNGLELLIKAAQKRKEAKSFNKTSSQRDDLYNEAQVLEDAVKKMTMLIQYTHFFVQSMG